MSTKKSGFKIITFADMPKKERIPPTFEDDVLPSELTWEIILSMEPRLNYLLEKIDNIRRVNQRVTGNSKLAYSYALDRWYGYRGYDSIVEKMEEIIGWYSNNPHSVLRTQSAHQICYEHLLGLLKN